MRTTVPRTGSPESDGTPDAAARPASSNGAHAHVEHPARRDDRLVSIIMPALNEAECIEQAIASIPREAFRKLGLDTEIIVVDNGSDDGTGEIARRAGARVLSERTRGYGHAYRRGFSEARGAIICTMDADQTYPSEAMPGLVTKLVEEEIDFINTDRFALMTNGVMSRRNRLGNAMLSMAGRALFQHGFNDSQSGMWVFRSALLSRMRLRAGGMALSQEIKIEAASRLKVRCAEVPINYGYRVGESKLRVWRDGVHNLLHLLRERLR